MSFSRSCEKGEGIFLNHIRAFFRNHDGWSIGITRYDIGHDRGVNNAKAVQSVNAQSIIDNSHIIVAHFTGSDRMVLRISTGAYVGLQLFELGHDVIDVSAGGGVAHTVGGEVVHGVAGGEFAIGVCGGDLVDRVVDPLEHLQDHPAGGEPEQRTTDRLLHEQHADVGGIEGVPVHGHAEDGQEDHDRHAVVEQRFPGNGNFQRLAGPGGLEDAHHRDRVGGRDQGAEQQAVDERQGVTGDLEQPVAAERHQEHAAQHAEGGEDADGPLARQQVVQVHVHGACEQQEAEHAVEQRLVELDLADDALGDVLGRTEACVVQQDQQQREQQRDHHDADGGRQLERADVDPGEQRRHGDQDARYRQQAHRDGGFAGGAGAWRVAVRGRTRGHRPGHRPPRPHRAGSSRRSRTANRAGRCAPGWPPARPAGPAASRAVPPAIRARPCNRRR